ncbi:MAG: GYD domain-containing protein [Actinobacteria bacterium]|nr:GYD domain-containing protein [Actinomycetota bacterium]
MVRRIMLMKVTDQGLKDIKNAPQRIEQGIKTFENMGGKILGFYTVTGEYDYIVIGEAPSDEVGMAFIMGLCAQGNVSTTTINAYTKEEFAEIVKKLQ